MIIFPTRTASHLFAIMFVACTLLCTTASHAQVPRNAQLYRTLYSKDSLLFNVAFNTCDLRPLDDLISDTFEFYHDKGGLTSGKAAFIASIKNGICNLSYKARRELDTASLEVYPLEKNGVLYGAIQSGTHRFYAHEKDGRDYFTSKAKFTHVWLLEGNSWKLSRGLSYDHQTVNMVPKATGLFDDEAAIEKWLKENHVPVLGLGIVDDGKLRSVKVFGELKPGTIAPYNTIFNVASVTKTITGILTMKLVNMGKWQLDEPLDKYWIDPDIAADPRHKKLTTRLVLSHQTGFPNWRYMNKTGKLAFEFDPGTRYQYSGEGMEYLRKALEKKFHVPFEKLADSLIFKPLGMEDTRLIWNESKVAERFAIGYNPQGVAYENNRNTKANAADDMLTTIEDYGKFAVHVLNGAGISDKLYTELFSHQVQVKKNKYMSLGWEVYDLGNGDFAVAHGGGDQGVQTEVVLFPKTNKALIIFTNVDDGYKVYEQLFEHYLGEQGKQIVDIELGRQ